MSKLFLTESKINGLLQLASTKPRDFALFHLALATGFRAGDLLSLQICDIANNSLGIVLPTIKIRMQKTGKIVERNLPEACRIALYLYINTRNDRNPYLFPGRNAIQPLDRSTLHRIYKRYLAELLPKADLRGAACHTTRRSVAKIISDKAGRIEPATRFLGHTSIGTTIAYLDMDGYGKQADEIVKSLPWNHNS